MPVITRIFSSLKKVVLYCVSASIGVFGVLLLIGTIAIATTRLTQPSDSEISLQTSPHDKEGKRVYRLPAKELEKRPPLRKET